MILYHYLLVAEYLGEAKVLKSDLKKGVVTMKINNCA